MSHQESIPVLTTVHPPVPPPSLADRADISDTPTHHTHFHHPAYPLGEDLLLRLPAFDHPDGGLTHAVALDCLTIIAANAVGGYLAKTKDGPAIDVTRYAVLTEKDYFFIVPYQVGDGENGGGPEEPYKYPICPSFTDWTFPHNCLPPDWSSQTVSSPPTAPKPPSGLTEKILLRDNACILTGHQTSIQACHLCPRAEGDWFWRNSMDKYALEQVTRADYAIDDSTNGITLRSDLHMEFDAYGFVLMRKSEHGYTVHCLRATPDILPAHHNRQTRPLTTIRPEFIYTRLAYAIFPLVSGFLNRGQSLKRVIRLKADSGTGTEIVDVAAKEFRKPPPRSQNSSPRKRSQQASLIDESCAQDLPSDPSQNLLGKCKRARARASSSTTSSPLSTPPAFRSAPTSCLSEKELQDLKDAWVGWQRPPGYVPLQKGDGERMDFTWRLGDERKGDFEGESPLGDWDEVAEASS